MKIMDLTRTIHQGMPVYPGTPEVDVREIANIEEHGFAEKQLCLASHVGTHVDAPAHLIEGGLTLDQFKASAFTGPARVIRVTDEHITPEHVKHCKPCEFILFNTGWDAHWGGPRYYGDFPSISQDAARFLAKMNLKGIGLDTPSPDPMGSKDYAAHHALLDAGTLVMENLANLSILPDREFTLVCAPLLIAGSDGAPARVLAIIR